MSAQVLTEAGSPIPAELMSKWCEMIIAVGEPGDTERSEQ